jgi:aminotransferase
VIQVFSNDLGDRELAAVRQVFESRWLGRGVECTELERELALYWACEPGSVLLTNCATSAAYIGLQALGVHDGDEVIIPAVHFVGVANAILACGAVPVFADVDHRTLNIGYGEIDRLRTSRTVGVMLLHYGGHPCDMAHIYEQAAGLWVFEDAANAVASTYRGKACGTLADAGVWSFDAMKVLVMGDGGALYMCDEACRERAEVLRYMGLSKGTQTGQTSDAARWWEYEVETPSGRYISNDVAAAIGRVQLRRLPHFVKRQSLLWSVYQVRLRGVGDLVLPPEPLPDCESTYYLYWVQTPRRDELASSLRSAGVYCTYRYYPLHWVQRFADGSELPGAEKAAMETLCLPLHNTLTDQEQRYVIDQVAQFYGE